MAIPASSPGSIPLNNVNTTPVRDATIAGVNSKQIMASQSQLVADIPSTLLDKDWLKQSFMIGNSFLSNPADGVNRFWSSASSKFSSAVIGSSIAVNNRAQYTRYADIRVKGRLKGRNDVTLFNTSGNYGMGRYYSEAIDDNAQKIFMRFGVPQYNSLVSFLLGAADPDSTQLARTGRLSTAYKISKLVTGIAMFVSFPVLSTAVYIGKAVSSLFAFPTSKYYTVKPTMHLYWSSVNMLANTIAVNRGLLPAYLSSNPNSQKISNLYQFDTANMEELATMFPGIMDSSGYFDVFAIASRPQVLANNLFTQDYNDVNPSTTTDFTGYVNSNNANDPRNKTYVDTKEGYHNFAAYINEALMFSSYFMASGSSKNSSGIETDPRGGAPIKTEGSTPAVDANGNIIDNTTAPTTSNAASSPGWISSAVKYFDANIRDGAEFAIFQVDYTGSVSESFSNSAVDSEIANKINSTSSEAREARFSLENGNLLGGAIGGLADTLVSTVKDVASGVLAGATFGLGQGVLSALGILAGQGYIDIPKHWQSSSASLPRSTYNIKLISPYGNPISQMMNIYIPLSMILAGALPLSTGKQSYTSPFLVQLWDRGRIQIQTGMIDSLTITRGVSNLGFTNTGVPLAIDVSFSVMDLSSIMHMPVSTGSLFNGNIGMDADNILMDYLAVLAGQDIYSQIYAIPRAKLNLAKTINNYRKLISPAYWANLVGNTAPAGILKAAVQGNSSITNPLLN